MAKGLELWRTINVGDIVNLKTWMPRRAVLTNYVVVGKPTAPGYEGLIIEKPQPSAFRGRMYIPGVTLTQAKIIGYQEQSRSPTMTRRYKPSPWVTPEVTVPVGVRTPEATKPFMLTPIAAEQFVSASQIKETLYHGSAAVDAIVKRGFDIEAKRVADVGDFGWGIYLGTISSARAAGGKTNVIAVKVDIRNPLRVSSYDDPFIANLRKRLGDTIHESIIEGKTVTREEAARRWAKEIQKAGYDAVIYTEKGRLSDVVIFDVGKIRIIGAEAIPKAEAPIIRHG